MSNQHYAPQALLKNFALDTSKRQAYVIKIDLVKLRVKNKTKICLNKEIRAESIKNICSEVNYLNTKFENFDKKFDLIDNQAPSVIKRILSSNDSNKICKFDKEILSKFAAYQYIRGYAARKLVEEISEYLSSTARKILELFNFNIPLLRNDKEHIKESQASLISKADLLIVFLNSLILDIITTKENEPELIIGDSPLLYDATGYGIYVPINPTKCLWFHCQESETPLRSRYLNELQLFASTHHVIARSRETLEDILTNPVSFKELEHLDDSYWKCILETRDSRQCVERQKKLIKSNIEMYF